MVRGWELVLVACSVVFAGLAAVSFLLTRAKRNPYPRLSLLFAILAFGAAVLSFVVAAVSGRIWSFSSAVTSHPVKVVQAAFTGEDLFSPCVVDGNPKTCMKNCCRDMFDPSFRFKDCSRLCDSHPTRSGSLEESGDCAFDDVDTFCDISKLQGVTGNKGQACNNDPSLGAITCTCCMEGTNGDNKRMYWDCHNKCTASDLPVSVMLPTSRCLSEGTTDYKCA